MVYFRLHIPPPLIFRPIDFFYRNRYPTPHTEKNESLPHRFLSIAGIPHQFSSALDFATGFSNQQFPSNQRTIKDHNSSVLINTFLLISEHQSTKEMTKYQYFPSNQHFPSNKNSPYTTLHMRQSFFSVAAILWPRHLGVSLIWCVDLLAVCQDGWGFGCRRCCSRRAWTGKRSSWCGR